MNITTNVTESQYQQYLPLYHEALSYIPKELQEEFIFENGKILFTNQCIQTIYKGKKIGEPGWGGIFNVTSHVIADKGYSYGGENLRDKNPEILLAFDVLKYEDQLKVFLHEFSHFIDIGNIRVWNAALSKTEEWKLIIKEEVKSSNLTLYLNNIYKGIDLNREFFAEECKTYLLRDKFPTEYSYELAKCPNAIKFVQTAVQTRIKQGTSWLEPKGANYV